MTDSTENLWNVDMEVNLFHAMRGHKPAGINRHFQMVSIHERLSAGVKKLTSADIWDHLATLYDLRALNESEVVPFPNRDVSDFEFLENEMLDLCHKSFPRSSYFNSVAETKASVDKSTPKLPKTEVKGEVKAASAKTSTPTSSAPKLSTVASSTPKSSTPSNPTPKSSKPQSNNTPSKPQSNNTPSKPQSSNTPSKPLPPTPSSASSLSQSQGLADPSPGKRTKRTRNVLSATNSPATPTEPPQKRRR